MNCPLLSGFEIFRPRLEDALSELKQELSYELADPNPSLEVLKFPAAGRQGLKAASIFLACLIPIFAANSFAARKPSKEEKARAAKAVEAGQKRDKAQAKALFAQLQDENEHLEVRVAAALSLAQMGEGRKELERVLGDEKSPVSLRMAAVSGLALFRDDGVKKALRKVLKETKNEELREHISIALEALK